MVEGSMEKLDLKKTLKYLYEPSARAFSVVDVPPMNFIMIDGHGDPTQQLSRIYRITACPVHGGLHAQVQDQKGTGGGLPGYGL